MASPTLVALLLGTIAVSAGVAIAAISHSFVLHARTAGSLPLGQSIPWLAFLILAVLALIVLLLRWGREEG
jgi:ABC-type Fe3+-siderophore transport system permease subunit